MLAKKIAIAFGIAVIFPFMIHYGVSTFHQPPDYDKYHIDNYYQKYKDASKEEKITLERKKSELASKLQIKKIKFQKTLFYVAIPFGILAIIIGTFIISNVIGTGLIFGGIFSIMDGFVNYWYELSDAMIFSSLLGTFIIIIFVSYKKIIS